MHALTLWLNSQPQVVWDAFAARYGDGMRSIALLVIPLVGQFFCGMASITSNSR